MQFLLKIVLAAVLLTLFVRGSLAQEQCISVEAALVQAAAAEREGARVHLLHGVKATRALKAVTDQIGPAPRELNLTGAILIMAPNGAVLALIESTQVCLAATLPRGLGQAALEAAEGRGI